MPAWPAKLLFKQVIKYDHSYAHSITKQLSNNAKHMSNSRVAQEQGMENIFLESLWADALTKQGWSDKAKLHIPYALAKIPRDNYNCMTQKLYNFCRSQGYAFTPSSTIFLADFFCKVADSFDRLKAQLVTASAAITCLYKITGV